MHATLCVPRFLIGSLWKKSSEKTQVVAQLRRKETEMYNCGYSAALLSKIEDILFEITSCRRLFSICTFSMADLMQFNEAQIFICSPDLSVILRLVYPAAYSTPLLGWLIGSSNLPCPKQNISFRITGRKESSEISMRDTELGSCPPGDVAT